MYLPKKATGCLIAVLACVSAQDCLIQSSLQGSGAQNLAYALQNVSCAVNTGYTQLFTFNNISSIISSATNIVSVLGNSNTYLQASSPEDSAANADIWRGPMNDFPFEFQQWADQLAKHKTDIVGKNLVSSLVVQLASERSAAESFIEIVLSKLVSSQQNDVKSVIMPALSYLDCAIGMFNTGSTVTACSSGAAASTTSVSSSASSTTSSSTSTTSSSEASSSPTLSTTSAATSPTSTHSAASIVKPSALSWVMVSLMLTCFAGAFGAAILLG